MASKRDIARQKLELVGRLDALRDSLGPDRPTLIRRINPLRAMGGTLGRHPLRTFGFTCLGASVLTMAFRRRRRPRKEKKLSLTGALAATLIAALRPALKQWVAYMVKQQISQRANARSADSLLGR